MHAGGVVTRLNKERLISFFGFLALVNLYISSIVKPTESFFQGGERALSQVIGMISNSGDLLAISSVFLMIAILLYYFNFKALPKLPLSVSVYIAFKVLVVFMAIYQGIFSIEMLFSVFLTIFFPMFVLVLFYDNYEGFLESCILISVLFVALNLYEYILNLESVVWAGRLYGITNHPNFMGGYSGLMLILLIAVLFVNKYNTPLTIVLIFLLLIFIMLSGSRASLFATFLGVVVFLYRRGVSAGITIILGLLSFSVALTFFMYSGDTFDLDRLVMSENTRADVYSELWTVFSHNPIIGDAVNVESTSNSYLSAFARFGMIGGLLVVLSIVLGVIQSLGKSMASILSSSLLAFILFYSAFEGVLVESFSFGQLVFLIALVLPFIGSMQQEVGGEG